MSRIREVGIVSVILVSIGCVSALTKLIDKSSELESKAKRSKCGGGVQVVRLLSPACVIGRPVVSRNCRTDQTCLSCWRLHIIGRRIAYSEVVLGVEFIGRGGCDRF